MKKTALSLLILLLASLACSIIPSNTVLGSGNVIRQSFEAGGVDTVVLNTIGRVELVLGESDSLVVETDDNILPHLKVKVEDGTLILDEEVGLNLRPSLDIIYRLSLRSLSSVTVSSSGIVSAGPVKGGSMELHVNGSGQIHFENIEADELKVIIAGSGEVSIPDLTSEDVRVKITASGGAQLSGACDSLTVESSGSGQANLEGLKADEVTVRNQASGVTTVWAVDSLDVTVGGSGEVFYYGSPALMEKVTGSGKLVHLEVK